MSAKSFASILQEKIQKQDQHRPSQVYDPAYLSYLLGQIAQTKVSSHSSLRNYTRQSYGSQKSGPEVATPAQESPLAAEPQAPKVEVPPRKVHNLDPQQERAYLRFLRHGVMLGRDFLESELKQTYRHLARELHPDTCSSSLHKNGFAFVEVKAAYDELKRLFSKV